MGETAALAVAVTIAVAAVGALWKVVDHVHRHAEAQQAARHDLRAYMQTIIAESENRVTARIERLEQLSLGFRQHYRSRNDDRDE